MFFLPVSQAGLATLQCRIEDCDWTLHVEQMRRIFGPWGESPFGLDQLSGTKCLDSILSLGL